MQFLTGTLLSSCMANAVEFLTSADSVLLSELIEIMIPCTSSEMFTLRKKYKLVESVESSNGKWADNLGNGFFIESDYLMQNLILQMKEGIFNLYRQHNHADEYF